MQASRLDKLLDHIEKTGNRLPHPVVVFLYLCLTVIATSQLASWLDWQALHPVQHTTIAAQSLLSEPGLQYMLSHSVSNFTQFAPVGVVMVVMLGLGLAEHSGLLGALLRSVVVRAPSSALSLIVVFAGVLSSLAADAGYVVLIPLAGALYLAAGRSPIAGISAAFAGVSGGFSANLLIGPVDAMLAGISSEAVALVADHTVSAAANWYFIAASTLLLTLVISQICDRWVEPRLGKPYTNTATEQTAAPIKAAANKGFKAVVIFSFLYLALITLSLQDGGVLRGQPGLPLASSLAVKHCVILIALYMAIAGWLFGRANGLYQKSADVVAALEHSMATLAGYLVLMFFAAQFVNYFAWSQLGSLIAIAGASMLQSLALPSWVLLPGFILIAAFINIFIGSASAKWALMAPIFVPMLYLLGISPEAAQMAYRIGDSSSNIISPLMPYFALVLAFCQQHQRDLGLGTLMATMLPYSVALLVCWSILLVVWAIAGLPLGPNAEVLLP